MNKDEDLKIRYYDIKEERKRIYDSIIEEEKEESFQEGVLHKQKEMIINMYNKGLSLEIISSCANLSVDEVKKIIKI